MMQIRPHKIEIKRTDGGGYDNDGNPIPVNEYWDSLIPCHYNTHGRQLIYQHPDGRAIVYDYVVFIDPVNEDYTGKFVRLTDQYGNVVEREKQVQKCVKAQLFTKLYL